MDLNGEEDVSSDDEEEMQILRHPRLEMERRHPFALFEFNDVKIRQLLRLNMCEISALTELLWEALVKQDCHRPIHPLNRVCFYCILPFKWYYRGIF